MICALPKTISGCGQYMIGTEGGTELERRVLSERTEAPRVAMLGTDALGVVRDER
jgi:hypothetical protein